MKISVIIPVYNERSTIEEILSRVHAVPIPKEIIIVDDHSTDGTREFLLNLDDPAVRVLCHEKNLGKGSALITGLEQAKGDVIIIQDGDLEYDPRDYPRLVEPINRDGATVVYGSRFSPFYTNLIAIA